MTKKKVIRIFQREKGKFFPEKSAKICLRPPKLGSRSPPMAIQYFYWNAFIIGVCS